MEPSFGRWLRVRRRALDLTQDGLARQVGCSVVTIRKIEADERRPSRQIAERLADSLQIPDGDRAALITLARAESYIDLAAAPAPESAARAGGRATVSLPVPLTDLIGRKEDIAALRTTLTRSAARLLTLTGPPGIGKTSLSIAVAWQVCAAFGDGAAFVALAPVSDPALVPAMIARALGVAEMADQPPLRRLKSALQEKRFLLVLDNFEQVVEAGPQVVELLEACPGLKVLITSRTALHVRGERIYPVPALPLPDLTRPPAAVARNPAVALFVERARAALPGFRLTEQHAAAVAEICVRLDGLPLAIELAAVQARWLAPSAILARLSDRFALLMGGARDLPARHQALRTAIDWSHELLSAAEQRLFRRLAVFMGGWTLDAAAEVCARDGEPGASVVDVLRALVDKSLVQQVEGAGGEPRFYRLETIQAYALERLEASGEEQDLRRRHAEYGVALAEAAEPHLYGAGQDVWVRRLEAEHDNLRAALAWAVDREPALGLRLAGALGWFWHLHGHHREGCDWLLRALDAAGATGVEGDRFRAKALNQAGYLAMFLRDLTRANALLAESVAFWRMVDDPRGLAHALCDWGALLGTSIRGNSAQARALLEESIALLRRLDAKQGLSRVCFWHGLTVAFQGDFVAARASAEESMRLGREIGDISNVGASMSGILAYIAFQEGDYAAGQAYCEAVLRLDHMVEDRPGIALVLGGLGSLIYLQGRYAQARPALEERLRIWRELHNLHGIAWSLNALGYLSLRQDDVRQAAAQFAESMALWRELNQPNTVVSCLAGMAEVAQSAGQADRAALLLSATLALFEARNARVEDVALDVLAGYPLITQADLERQAAGLRGALGEAAFAAAWAAGRAMSLEQAAAYALGEA